LNTKIATFAILVNVTPFLKAVGLANFVAADFNPTFQYKCSKALQTTDLQGFLNKIKSQCNMTYNKITPLLIKQIKQLIGEKAVFTDAQTLEKHSYDYTENLKYLPEIVVEPENTEGVSALLKICRAGRCPFWVAWRCQCVDLTAFWTLIKIIFK
jgi:hypothetical protein